MFMCLDPVGGGGGGGVHQSGGSAGGGCGIALWLVCLDRSFLVYSLPCLVVLHSPFVLTKPTAVVGVW